VTISLPVIVLDEALDALLTRVRWYTVRGYKIPGETKLAFNSLCDVLERHGDPWSRIP